MEKPVSDEKNNAYLFNRIHDEINILRRQVADLQKRVEALQNDEGIRQAVRDALYARRLRDDQ